MEIALDLAEWMDANLANETNKLKFVDLATNMKDSGNLSGEVLETLLQTALNQAM